MLPYLDTSPTSTYPRGATRILFCPSTMPMWLCYKAQQRKHENKDIKIMDVNTEMINHIFPKITSGRILTKEILEILRDYPINVLDLLFLHFSDGIITGFTIASHNDSNLVVEKGIVKHDGRLYLLLEDLLLSKPSENGEYLIKLIFHMTKEDDDFIIYHADILVESIDKTNSSELELGSINYTKGFDIKCGLKTFSDEKEYVRNHLKTQNVIYSSMDLSGTFSPFLLKLFGLELLEKAKNSNSAADLSFSFLCQNSSVNRTSIISYINLKTDTPCDHFSNSDIYNKLCEILDEWEPQLGEPVVTGTSHAPKPKDKRTLIE